ncbi:MAG: alpha/beta hydrolase [Holdemanella sp.]|nr:alpha/beta hydrolase [Holdemanella sp.]
MILKESIYITPFQCDRLLHIYIPDDRKENETFPVLYMFDGHNLFYDEDATYGTCWGMKEYLDTHHSRLIVVGLECNHEGVERIKEFSPYTYQDEEPWGFIEQKGRVLIQWMKTELISWVEHNLPARKGRKNHYIGGSSMGGTMALYMALKHSDTYSKAICVSPHIYPMYKSLRKDLNHSMVSGTEVYISWGGQEYEPSIFAMATDQNLQIIRALMKKEGVDVIPHCFKNDNHSESAWKKELPIWMKELHIGETEKL